MDDPTTREIDLYMPASDGFGLYAGSATMEVDPIDRRMTGLTAVVEKGTGKNLRGREINCLIGSDALPFDDKPVAALVENLAAQWLAGAEGQAWLDSLQPTRSELRHMAHVQAQSVAGAA